MSTIVQEWENEHSQSAYPFTQDALYNNIIVDASFQQFANSGVTLNYIQVNLTSLDLNLTYDIGTSDFTLQQSDYLSGINYIRLVVGTRYVGRITFQDGVNTLWNNYVGQQLNFNLSFVATTIRSFNLNAGVYSIAGITGNVIFGTTDSNVFYNSADSDNGNFITFNAVGNHELPETTTFQALKKLNLLTPISNNIFISSSDVVQINGDGIGSLNVSLVGSQPGSNQTKIADTTSF